MLDLRLAMPKESGGQGGATNPEQLFAGGYAACFESAVIHVTRKQAGKVRDGDIEVVAEVERSLALDERTSVKAAVGIGKRDDGEGFGLDIALTIRLPGVAPDVARGLIAKAHVVCPYSHLAQFGLGVRTSLAD
jgi:osmotically inducible protein OsmC